MGNGNELVERMYGNIIYLMLQNNFTFFSLSFFYSYDDECNFRHHTVLGRYKVKNNQTPNCTFRAAELRKNIWIGTCKCIMYHDMSVEGIENEKKESKGTIHFQENL